MFDKYAFQIFLTIALVIMAVALTHDIMNDSWKREAIEKNHAEYNSRTGEWQWKESCP